MQDRPPAQARWVHAGFVLVTAAACLWYLAVDVRAQAAIHAGVIVLSVGAIWYGRRRHGSDGLLAWRLLASGLLLLVVPKLLLALDVTVADAGYYSPVRHLCMMFGYAGLLSGSVVLVVRHAPSDSGGVIEAALIGLSGAGVAWEALLRPRLLALGISTAGQIPVLVQVLLLTGLMGALLRVATTTVRARASLNYLFCSSVGTLLGITLSAATAGGQGTGYPDWVRVFWFFGFLGVAAAALHPSSAWVNTPDAHPPDELTPRRLVRLGLVLTVSPIVAVVSQLLWDSPDVMVLAFSTGLAIPLVLLRFWQLAAQRAQAQQALAYQATHDELTGLPNRRAMLAGMKTALSSSATPGAAAALFVDLDGFKPINDTYGHEAGDLVLQVVARRLRLNVRPGDLVGRLGGDEFLVFCPGAGEREAATIRERLRQCLQEPVLVGEVACRVSASIGVSTGTPLQGVTAHQLITDADTAMYAEKRAHRDNARTDVGLTGCAGGR